MWQQDTRGQWIISNAYKDRNRKEAEDEASGFSTHLREEGEGEEVKQNKSNADETELMRHDHEGEVGSVVCLLPQQLASSYAV